jgi:hypothetical protein
MSSRDWTLPPRYPLCVFADSFYRTAQDTIFRQLGDTTTPEQFQAAQECLKRLRETLEKDMPPMHYGAQIGTHRCVRDLCKEASARLRNLALLQPTPQPPAPAQQLITREGIVIDLEERIQTSIEETDLGTDDNPSDNGISR